MHEQTLLNEWPLTSSLQEFSLCHKLHILHPDNGGERGSREQEDEDASNNLEFPEILPGLWVPAPRPGLLSPGNLTKEG